MSQSLAPGSAARRSVIVASHPIPDIGRRLWDDEPSPVGTYAGLCTCTPDAARELASQAQERPPAAPWGESSRADELPTVPAALNSVLGTAMELASFPDGVSLLSPELLNWVKESGGQPLPWQSPTESLALRSLRAMDPLDSELLWWSCVEGLSDAVIAGRLGVAPADMSSDVVRVRADFREQGWLLHHLQLESPVCLSYAGLLDATARQSSQATPSDLLDHLGRCSVCAGAFECLSVSNALLPDVIADAALRWSGSAYVARRRGQLSRRSASAGQRPSGSRRRPTRGCGIRIGRRPALKAATAGVGIVLLGGALSLLGSGTAPEDERRDTSTVQPESGAGITSGESVPGGRRVVAQQPVEPERSAPASAEKDSAPPSAGGSREPSGWPGAEPSGNASASPSPDEESRKQEPSPPPACSAALDVRNRWNKGIEAELGIVPRTSLGAGWKVTFRVPAGARIEVWNGAVTKEGGLVTVTAATYNTMVPENGTLTIGMVVAFDHDDAYIPDAWISDVKVNGGSCSL
ncbi:cellulose binding domain-containing protein [Streptomyces microflavus]|uniref:cellulose binding domain-containing protein n=1 Tax=Streptomyces microflavus TaxID=1919 RepID=UPI003669E719